MVVPAYSLSPTMPWASKRSSMGVCSAGELVAELVLKCGIVACPLDLLMNQVSLSCCIVKGISFNEMRPKYSEAWEEGTLRYRHPIYAIQ
jgi:hypothetical protein